MLVKPFGPFQLQVTGIVLLVDADNVNSLPEHTGEFEDAVGVAGVSLMITLVVPAGEVQPFCDTVTLYVPLYAVDTEGMDGFCWLLVNPFGPVQLYDKVPVVDVLEVRFKVAPLQSVLLFDAVGVAGDEGSDKLNGPTGVEGQLLYTTYTLAYAPAVKPEMMILPEALLVILTVTGPVGAV